MAYKGIPTFFHGDRCGCIIISVGQAFSDVLKIKWTARAISLGCIINSELSLSYPKPASDSSATLKISKEWVTSMKCVTSFDEI